MSPADQDRVAVVIPVFNGARFLADAVAYARADATHVAEVVVVDDGSTDDLVRRVATIAPAVRFVRQPNGGPAAARNRGLREVSSEFVAFLDVDDQWPADRFQGHLRVLSQHPEIVAVLGRTQYVGLSAAEAARYRFTSDDHAEFVPHISAATFRARAFETVGPFDESLRQYEDYDWFLRARDGGHAVAHHDAIAHIYRRRPDSASQLAGPTPAALLAVLKRSIARRRALTEQLPKPGEYAAEPRP